jgi:hypothetical protein
VGLSNLERDGVGGRLEIHVVLDDGGDTELTALGWPPTASQEACEGDQVSSA